MKVDSFCPLEYGWRAPALLTGSVSISDPGFDESKPTPMLSLVLTVGVRPVRAGSLLNGCEEIKSRFDQHPQSTDFGYRVNKVSQSTEFIFNKVSNRLNLLSGQQSQWALNVSTVSVNKVSQSTEFS
jgi:hypothetical protein